MDSVPPNLPSPHRGGIHSTTTSITHNCLQTNMQVVYKITPWLRKQISLFAVCLILCNLIFRGLQQNCSAALLKTENGQGSRNPPSTNLNKYKIMAKCRSSLTERVYPKCNHLSAWLSLLSLWRKLKYLLITHSTWSTGMRDWAGVLETVQVITQRVWPHGNNNLK